MARTKNKNTTYITVIFDGEQHKYAYSKTKSSVKKENKDGKIKKYNSSYYTVSIPTGELYKNGRIKYHQIHANDTSELYDKITDYLSKKYHQEPENKYLKDDIKAWLVKDKLNTIKPTSYDSMEYIINHYIIPYIGDCEVSKVTTNQIQSVINKALEQGLSKSILYKIKTHLYDYFKSRKKQNTIVDFSEIKMPSESRINEIREDLGKKVEKKMFFEPEQVKAIQNVIYNGYDPKGHTRDLRPKEERDKDKAKKHTKTTTYDMPHQSFEQGIIFDFMFQTGLRASEMCALKFSDWDPKKHTINIRYNRTPANKRDINGEKITKETRNRSPKTKNSSAVLTLSQKANSIMQQMYDNDEYKNYVAHKADGQPINRDVLRGRWHRILRAAKIETQKTPSGIYKEEYGLHTIRHTYASLLYQKYHSMSLVSKKLRHSNPSFTANIYVSILRTYEDTVDEEFEV